VRGWVSWSSLVLLGVAALCAALFVRHEARAAEPLISPALLRDHGVRLVAGACVAGVVLMGGNSLFMPFFLQLGKGLGVAAAGLLLLVYSVTFTALSPFTGRLADRHSPRRISAVAMGIGAAACVGMALTAGSPGYAPVVAFLIALAVTYALFMPANSTQVLQAPPEEERGAGPALLGTLNTLGLLVGASLFKAAFAASVGTSDPALAGQTAGAAGGSASAAAGSAVEGAGSAAAAAGSAAGSAASAAAHGWWLAGFSPAYLVGAMACGVALTLCLVGSRRRRASGGEDGRRARVTAGA
jgi:predicted MFS family arabinose efflux permease